MTAKELRLACAILNMNYSEMARHLDVNFKTLLRWKNGDYPVPRMAELVINKMLEDAERGAGEYARGETE